MAEDENMEDLCSVVTLMHMVNPSTFWVKEPYQDEMSKEQTDLWNMEEILTRQFKRSSDYGVGTFIEPKDGEMVAVRNHDSGCWHRGILKYKVDLNKGYAYHVFLVDHGIQLQVSRSDIRKLPDSMRSLTHQAYQLCLYGVVPITLEIDYFENRMMPKVSKDWTSAAFSFVNDIVNNYRTAHFIRKSTVGEKVYGDLFIIIEDEQQNLASILCDNNFATYQRMSDVIGNENTKLTCNLEVKLDSGSPSLYNTPTRNISKLEDYLQELKRKGKQKGDENNIEEWKSRNDSSQISSEDAIETHEEKSAIKIFPLGRGHSLLQSIKDVTPGKNQEGTTLQLNTSKEWEIKQSCLKLLHLLSPPKSVLNDNDLNMSKSTTPTTFTDSPFAKIKMESDDTEQETYPNAMFIPSGADTQRYSKPKLLKNSSSADYIRKHSPSFSKRQLPSKQDDTGIKDRKVHNETPSILDLLNKYTFQAREHLEESESKEIHEFCVKEESENKEIHKSCVKEETLKKPVESPTKSVCQTPKPKFLSEMVKMLGPLEDKKVSFTEVKEASSGYTHNQSCPSPKNWKSEDTLEDISELPAISPQTAFQLPSEQSDILERIKGNHLLIHGKVMVPPITRVADAPFPIEIYKALKKRGIQDAMSIQSYLWPAISYGQSMIVVSSAQSGKTMSYIPPLLGNLLTSDVYKELKPSNHPYALVLCSGTKTAQHIYETCCDLLHGKGHGDVKVIVTYGGGAEMEKMVPLISGCHILISTPRCFLRLLNVCSYITGFNRLCHLILDEADVLTLKFLPEIKIILNECHLILKKRTKFKVPLQVVAMFEKWCPAIESLVLNFPHDSFICIGSLLEAALYAKLRPSLHIIEYEKKPNTLISILEENHGLFKTVIVCQSVKEMESLLPFLKPYDAALLVAHEEMPHFYYDDLRKRWNSSVSGSFPILVCSDALLEDLAIQDAMWLIHYSLPSESKTQFGHRFKCLQANYRNIFAQPINTDAMECQVHIFMDENNTSQLPAMVRFMKNLGARIGPQVQAKSEEIVKNKEMKGKTPLCHNVKAFGDCWNKTVCSERHVMDVTLDKLTDLPTCGEVKVKTLWVHSANHISVRLLEHKDPQGINVPVPDYYVQIAMDINAYYSNKSHRVAHGDPNLGDICGVESRLNLFQRVQVNKFLNVDSFGNLKDVQVTFLDEGTIAKYKVYQLLSLPESLQKLPFQAIEVYFCRVMPLDIDSHFSEVATNAVANWLEQADEEERNGKYLSGKIVLSVGNTLWLDPFVCCEYLSDVDTVITERSMRDRLLEAHLAINNPQHIMKLYDLCNNAGLILPDNTFVVKDLVPKIKKVTEPQWAFLPDEEFTEVFFCAADTLDQFFVRLCKFDDVFKLLLEELQKYVHNNNNNHLEPEVGAFCCAKFPDDQMWYRAQILEDVGDAHWGIFFVDHGDRAKVSITNLRALPEHLMKKLPFQVIECCLLGVKPHLGTTWNDEASDKLYDLTVEDGCIRPIYAKVFDDKLPASCTGGRKHKIALVDTSTDTDIIINQWLIEENLVSPKDDEIQLLEHISVSEVKSDSEESEAWGEDSVVHQEETTPKSSVLLHFDLDDLDICIDDPKLFFANCWKIPQNQIEFLGLPSQKLKELPEPPLNVLCEEKEDVQVGDLSSSITQEDLPFLKCYTKTPQVLWCQDSYTVSIKINLTCVEQYYMAWNCTELLFSTRNGDDKYFVDLHPLFGGIKPENLKHSMTGQSILIKLTKVAKGFEWPSLLRGKKPKWVKVDYDHIGGNEEEDDVDLVKQYCDRASKNTILPKPKHIYEVGIHSEEESEGNLSSSDEEELEDESRDPYDPFN